MKTLDRYIGSHVLVNALIVLTVLVSLDSFFTFASELDDIGKGHYTLMEVIIYVLLSVPGEIYAFFPMSALIGAVLGLGVLSSNSELTVIRASGVSISRVVISLMKVGLLMMIAVVIIGEFLAPYSDQYAKSRRSLAKSDQIALKTRYGFWARDDRNYINIRSIKAGGVIGDIYIYEFDDHHRLRVSTHAKHATYADDKWVLHDIVQSFIDEKQITNQGIKRAEWTSLLSPSLLSAVVVSPQNMSTWDLRKYIKFLHDNGQDAEKFELAFWIKVFSPLSTGVMIFLAAPFVFGPLRSVGIGQRILVGTLCGLAFYIVNQAFNHLGLVYNISPLLSAMLPSLVFFIAAVLMMRRVQ